MADILIADDHEVVRSGYRRLFELGGKHKIIGEAGCGQQTISLFKQTRPDLLVIDVMMPGPGIVDTLQRLVSYEAKPRILVVSMHDSLNIVERCFKAGALGYVTKSSEAHVLMDGVAKVTAGKRFLSSDVAEKMALKHLNVNGASALSVLTPREFDVFIRLARGQDISSIANDMSISNKTIYNYTSKIKRQLAVSTTAELVHLALQESLLDSSDIC